MAVRVFFVFKKKKKKIYSPPLQDEGGKVDLSKQKTAISMCPKCCENNAITPQVAVLAKYLCFIFSHRIKSGFKFLIKG